MGREQAKAKQRIASEIDPPRRLAAAVMIRKREGFPPRARVSQGVIAGAPINFSPVPFGGDSFVYDPVALGSSTAGRRSLVFWFLVLDKKPIGEHWAVCVGFTNTFRSQSALPHAVSSVATGHPSRPVRFRCSWGERVNIKSKNKAQDNERESIGC